MSKVNVEYDLTPAMVESSLRDKLIEMGWTPPPPKEIWVNEYKYSKFNFEHFLYNSKSQATANARKDAVRVAVRYREVIEEEEE